MRTCAAAESSRQLYSAFGAEQRSKQANAARHLVRDLTAHPTPIGCLRHFTAIRTIETHLSMPVSDDKPVQPPIPPRTPSTRTWRTACPMCGGRLVEIRGKLQCSSCRTICETCCEGGRM